jgi:murein DD-endopeptidase MepM/ murein hydrolase activator NlpD
MTGGKDHRIIDRPSSAARPSRSLRRLVGIAATATLVVGAPAAFGANNMPSQLPGSGASAPPADSGVAPPAATTPAPAATTPAATTPAATTSLAFGSAGADVKSLQRKLRLRRIFVPVDGKYSARTRAGVRILQRKWHMKATGIADAALLARLGIKVRAVASTPAAPAAPVAYVAQYIKAFPVNGPHDLTDSFGDFRADLRGQGHQGDDIMSPRGTPVVAVADGTIKRLTRQETGLGGIWIWLVDNGGNEYYYAHLTDIVAGLDAGSKVSAGQQIGTVGNTGDARYGDPHLHFELHPGGGSALNPYQELLAADPLHGKSG